MSIPSCSESRLNDPKKGNSKRYKDLLIQRQRFLMIIMDNDDAI
jgi:hypothetical protein